MKFPILIAVLALCIALTTAKKESKKIRPEHIRNYGNDYNKGKREAAIHSYSSAGHPRSTHLVHLQPAGGSLSIGAGYSLGPKTSSFGYSSPGSFSSSHFPSLGSHSLNSFGNSYAGDYSSYSQPSGFGGHSLPGSKIRYTSISGNSPNGYKLGGTFGSVLSGSLSNTGPQSFGSSQLLGKPTIGLGVPQYASIAKPEIGYQAASYSHNTHTSLPSYASGIQGLGAYASGSHQGISGPLFIPETSHEGASTSYGVPSGSFGHLNGFQGQLNQISSGFGSSFGGLSSGKKYYSSKPSFKVQGSLNSFGGSTNEFKPSVYLGSSEVPSVGSGYDTSSHTQAHVQGYTSPSIGHVPFLSENPIYIAPKIVAAAIQSGEFDSGNSISQGSGDFHGSTSLTGSYDIPSAGHAASSYNFDGSSEYSSPSVSYGAPSVGANTYSGALKSQGSLESSATHGFGGYSTHESPAVSYSSLINHASGGYEMPSGSISSFGGSGSHFGLVDSEKHESSLSKNVFPGLSTSEHSFSSPSKTYGGHKGSYSIKNKVYSSPPSDYRTSESKYDTIKYSRELISDGVLHN